MSARPESPHLPYEVVGNVIYLRRQANESGESCSPDGPAGLQDLSTEQRTGLERLRASMSNRWPPERIRKKVLSLGLSGEMARRAMGFLTGDDYDADWAAEQELHRRMARGYGPRRVEADLVAMGFDREAVARLLGAVPAGIWEKTLEDWLAGEPLPGEASARKKKMESLMRRGFSIKQIEEYGRSTRHETRRS